MLSRTIKPVIEVAELLYGTFTSRFKRELPQPVITVQTKGRMQRTRVVLGGSVAELGARRIPEINLCAEHVRDGLKELAHSVLHEMVHYANWLDGIRDCSSSQYHNRHFRAGCEAVGLICEKHPRKRYGWAATRLSPELESFVDGLGIDEERLGLSRISALGSRRPGSKLKKWTCGCSNLWAAVEIDASCNRCGGPFRMP